MRVFGLMALLFALVCFGWAVEFAVHPEQMNPQPAPVSAAVGYVVVALPAGLLAVLVLTRRPFRPDLGDVAFSDRSLRWLLGLPGNWSRRAPRESGSVRRSWWTGEIIG